MSAESDKEKQNPDSGLGADNQNNATEPDKDNPTAGSGSDNKLMDILAIKDWKFYCVNSEEHLRLIGTDHYPLSANYILYCDITLEEDWIPIGHSDDVPFTGYFEGNGCTIKNISINDEAGEYKYLGYWLS